VVKAGVAEQVFRINGAAMFPGAPAPLLSWLDEHEPDALDRATTADSCKDAVFGRLTGVRATDPSDSCSTPTPTPTSSAPIRTPGSTPGGPRDRPATWLRGCRPAAGP
jgi:hypothetical protein